jgi:hypothetical protein
MGNVISVVRSTPLPATREFQDLLAHYRNRLGEIYERGRLIYSISDRLMPSPDEHRQFRERGGMLAAICAGSPEAEVGRRMVHLFRRFPGSRLPDAEVVPVMAAYAHDLKTFPLWAIEAGCLEFIRSGGQFAPSSPILRQTIDRQMAPVRLELAALDSVLGAEVWHERDPEEKARVIAEFDALVHAIGFRAAPARPGASPAGTGAGAEPIPADNPGARPAPVLSPALRVKMGLLEEIAEAR